MSLEPDRHAIIHDLGYRPYDGPRLGAGYIAWSLYKLGTRHCFGLGRSGRSKVLPFGLLAMMLLPTLILVGVVVTLEMNQQVVPYTRYPVITQLVISVFVAAQAPVLFSRDIRYQTLALYFARPLGRTTFVLVRYASLATGVLILVAAPLLVLYLGGLLADLPFRRETGDVAIALLGALLLAALLAAFGAVISAVTTRRGLAVAAIIVALVLSFTVVSAVRGIAFEVDAEAVGVAAGVFSPYTLVDGVLAWAFETPPTGPIAPTSALEGTGYLVVAALAVFGATALLMWRYRRLAGG
ncbi:MAG: ABC transporter permease [Nocardioidaceae bacterium]